MGTCQIGITSGINSEPLLACKPGCQMKSGRSLHGILFSDDIVICTESEEHVIKNKAEYMTLVCDGDFPQCSVLDCNFYLVTSIPVESVGARYA